MSRGYVGTKHEDRTARVHILDEWAAAPHDPTEVSSTLLPTLDAMMAWANKHCRLAPRRKPDERAIERMVRVYTKHDDRMGSRSNERLKVDSSG